MLHQPKVIDSHGPRRRSLSHGVWGAYSGRPSERRSDPFAIGLFVPMSGVAGIWGPSAIACATLAAEEINRAGGLRGRELLLKCFDASDELDDLTETTDEVVEAGGIDAIVGMHTSSVRRAVIAGCEGRVPYVYTALHEGGERSRGVYALGETPERQLRPAIEALTRDWSARRWMFIGNDYEWPRVSHQLARGYVDRMGARVLEEHYVPLGAGNFDTVLQRVADLRPDAVLLSLVGQDAIDFNRAFGASGLGQLVLRLSCAVEENILLAIGQSNTENLFVSSGYFGALRDDVNMSFKERYHQRFGQRAPTLNSLGQSTYEGVHFATALVMQSQGSLGRCPLAFAGVRGITWTDNDHMSYPVHLAQADGHAFEVVRSF
jgi:urea transport system substrate-binding protein